MDPLLYSMWPGETYIGAGAAAQVAEQVRRHGGSRVFVVTDQGVRRAGLLDGILSALDRAGLAWAAFDQVEPNPTDRLVGLAEERFKESGADALVAVGGGSSIDTAKAVQVVATGGGDILDYDLGLGEKARPTPNGMPPLIAIPTTAGTGSEVTAWAVITDTRRNFKTSVGDSRLIPKVALIDPSLMLTMPPSLTAAAGLDALSHCLESFVSTIHHPLGDAIAYHGITLIGESLRRAVANGNDMDARTKMATAAMIGGMSLNLKWGGACHSLAHQLSTQAGLAHGVAIALMLPHQMEYSLPGALEKYARVAEALGEPPSAAPLEDRARAAVRAVRKLIADIGLPTRLRDVGVAAEAIPDMARKAFADDSHATNPVKCTVDALAELYRRAY